MSLGASKTEGDETAGVKAAGATPDAAQTAAVYKTVRDAVMIPCPEGTAYLLALAAGLGGRIRRPGGPVGR